MQDSLLPIMRLSQLQKLVFTALGLIVLGLGLMAGVLRNLGAEEDPQSTTKLEVRRLPVPSADAWPVTSVWAAPQDAEDSARISRYALAGTFQVYRSLEGAVESAALVDDQEKGSQRIVREGDLLGAFLVGEITEDQLTLEKSGRTWVLTLSGVRVTPVAAETESVAAPPDPMDLPALATTKFGKLVKENYWVLERDAVKGYIDEMTEPQNALRTINLYRSFTQVAPPEGEEGEPGFQIGMKGEKSFFSDMGLQDGDIIRKVNSMKMRSQRRAEYLVREFYKDNMSAVVLDVERDGEIQQHIYLVR